MFVLAATSLSFASSSFYCSQWCLCDIWTNFSLASSLCFHSLFTLKISPQPSVPSLTSSPLPHKCFAATNMSTNVVSFTSFRGSPSTLLTSFLLSDLQVTKPSHLLPLIHHSSFFYRFGSINLLILNSS